MAERPGRFFSKSDVPRVRDHQWYMFAGHRSATVFYNSFKWQYMAVAGAGAEIINKGGAENK